MKNLNSIRLYKNPNISKHKIEINPIIKENNSLDLSDNQNNDDIFFKKMLINKKNRNKMSFLNSREQTTIEQNGENSSNKKTVSTSYNINTGPETFRYKYKSPMQFYKNWVNMSVNKNINKSFELNIKDNGNNKKKNEVKCCSIF
jgi:hypothetical protein